MNRLLAISLLLSFSGCPSANAQVPSEKPNIILIMTDDQGIGDVGYMGNPFVKTPNIDRLAARSTRFTNFHVSPVCAPTRAAVMTGKYPDKTGVYDTYNGGAIMATEEVTIAELLRNNGYRTGIFGKWHLGDNFPYRPIDQGFSHALVHRGGGIGQPGDADNYFAKDSSYFDPVLYRNEKRVSTTGYCSDVFTEEAIHFINQNREKPFFLYLAYNAPHTPLQVPQKYYDQYRHLSPEKYKEVFRRKDSDVEKMTERDFEDARKVYAMVTNIDDNIARIISTVEAANIHDNTIVIFMTDNGPQQRRYKAGYKGLKGSVYEGGVRVPFFIYGPRYGIENKEIDAFAAHIDILPTLMELTGVKRDLPRGLDGESLFGLISGRARSLPEKAIFTEWGRGYAVPYRNMSVRRGNYKLVGQTHYDAALDDFELYDLKYDPFEKNNIIRSEAETAQRMRKELDQWIEEVYSHPNNTRIHYIPIGAPDENPVVLNRNDTKGPIGIWTQSEIYGWWDVEVMEDGVYDFTFEFLEPLSRPGSIVLRLYPFHLVLPVEDTGSTIVEMKNVRLRKATYRLEPHYAFDGKQWLPLKVTVEKM